MGKKDLLKEAIADAKAVKETALASAKLALEEAFNPRIQSMLSRKIQQEVEDEEEPVLEPEVPVEEPTEEEPVKEEVDSSEIGTADNKQPSADSSEESTKDIEGPVKPEEPAKETDDFVTEQEDPAVEEPGEEEEDELDLEAIIKELEDEAEFEEPEEEEDLAPVAEDDEPEEVVPEEEPVVEEPPVEEPPVEEDEDLDIDIEDDEETEEPALEQELPVEEPAPEDEEELDIESLVKELENDEKEEDEKEKVAALESSLREHRKVIRLLKNRLNEINILNAKLLFTNKIFRNFSLSSKEKMKIIENFDRARNVREIKLVYATLCENLDTEKKVPVTVKRITEGASKVVKSTKPEGKILNEGSEQVARIQKLAGIKQKVKSN